METSSSDPSTTVADTYSDIIYEAFRKWTIFASNPQTDDLAVD